MHTYIYHIYICIHNPSKRDSCTAPLMVLQSQETRQGAILCEAPNWFKRIQTGGIWRCHLEAAGQGLTCLFIFGMWSTSEPHLDLKNRQSRTLSIFRIIQYCLYNMIQDFKRYLIMRAVFVARLWTAALCRALLQLAASQMRMHRKCIVIPVLGQCKAMQMGKWETIAASPWWPLRYKDL